MTYYYWLLKCRCYDKRSWNSQATAHTIWHLMNASPPVCQPVHPALLWPFQKSLGIVCKQSCHADEELPQDRSRLAGWLEIWSSSIQSSDTTVQHKDSTPECGHATGTFTPREMMVEMYVTLLQTVQIEAHYDLLCKKDD